MQAKLSLQKHLFVKLKKVSRSIGIPNLTNRLAKNYVTKCLTWQWPLSLLLPAATLAGLNGRASLPLFWYHLGTVHGVRTWRFSISSPELPQFPTNSRRFNQHELHIKYLKLVNWSRSDMASRHHHWKHQGEDCPNLAARCPEMMSRCPTVRIAATACFLMSRA